MERDAFELDVGGGYALVLRDESTVDEMLALTLANLDRLVEWEDWAQAPQTRQSVAAYTEYLVQGFVSGTSLPLAIRCGHDLVGSVGVRFDDSRHSAEIGYWIGRDHEGHGVVTRCVGALVDWLLTSHETERVELRCARTNLRSRAVAERLGFAMQDPGPGVPDIPEEPRHDLLTYVRAI